MANTTAGRRISYSLLALWPLALAYPLSRAGSKLWRDLMLVPAATGRNESYAHLVRLWPAAGLVGPIATLLVACALHRAGRAPLRTPLAGMVLAAALIVMPEARAIIPYIGHARPLALVDAAAGRA